MLTGVVLRAIYGHCGYNVHSSPEHYIVVVIIEDSTLKDAFT
jgi:hypothetical protein